MKPGLVLLFALACFCLSPGVARSQDPAATILGIVTDSSGSVLPGVSVTIKRVDTAQTRTMTSDEGGRYRVPLLSPGRYEVTAQLSGFQTVVRSGVTLTVGQEALVNIQMPIGNIAESVTVQAAAPLVETTTSSLSHVVNEQQLGALPLNGRDFSQLVLLQPGVVMSRSSVDSANVGDRKS